MSCDITIAVCTWNRAAPLRRTLTSFTALTVPAGLRWEVLVVDNNCTDNTPAVLAEFATALPLRVVHEPQQGAAHARNRAAQEARGEYLLGTDDDVEVEPDWLAAYWAAIQAHPQADVFGGVILPRFEGTPPAWLTATWDLVQSAYAGCDLSPLGFDLDPHRNHVPYGPNFVARTAALRRLRCEPQFGPRAGEPGVGEIRRLLAYILLTGGQGRWVPQARVHHWVPRSRQTVAFVRQHIDLAARQTFPLDTHSPVRSHKRLRRVLRASRRRYWLSRPFASPRTWMRHLIEASRASGRLALADGRATDPLYAIHRQVKGVHGFLAPRAGVTLYALARWYAPTAIFVELGSWQGRSAVWLGTAARDRGAGMLHAVDHWRGSATILDLLEGKEPDWLYRTFLQNIESCGLSTYVRPWRMSTLEAARQWSGEPIGLLYIDADHDYEAVRADFEAWAPYVAPGGYIVFDDVPSWNGPTRFLSQLPAASYEWITAPPNQWVVRKLAPEDAAQGVTTLAQAANV